MKPLSQTNPYIRDPKTRRRLLEENALDSSAFEGARGLQPLSPPAKRRSTAFRKKIAKPVGSLR
jgi:hypothetical protein